MARKTHTPFNTGFEFPKFDETAYKAFWTGNMAVAVKAQRMVIDAAEAMVARQFALTREAMETAQAAALNFDVNKKPEVYAEEIKVAAERAQSVVKTEADNVMKVQKDLADLVGKQVASNVDELKKLAA